jgi:iron complex transport system substrate-binding protein
VRARLRAGEPLYEIDEALLAELAPDVLITQTHCEVCAVSPASLRNGAGSAARLERRQVLALDTGTLEGILAAFGDVAAVLGAAEAGKALVAGIRARLGALAGVTGALPPPRPRVSCVEWTEPLFAMGNWGPELVTLAGGAPVLGAAGQHSTTVSWQRLCDGDPDVLVVAPCGFGLERTLREMPSLAARPGWADLRAVRSDRVFAADGNLYFNRSGPMLFETPEILAEILHPALFPPRHEGTAWQRYRAPNDAPG